MKKERKKTLKIALSVIGGVVVGAIAAYVASIYLKEPPVVKNPSWRTFNRADGIPKRMFNTALEAKNQAVKQFFRYGEICRPYQAGNGFFTGHSEKDLIKSVNPLKIFCKSA